MDKQHPMQEVRQILADLNDPRANNEPVLAVNLIDAQRAKNGGYPVHLYHETLEPVQALNRAQDRKLSELGYVRNYIQRDYPKFKFRRNMDAKFEAAEFIEERIAATREAEQVLIHTKPRAGGAECSAWVDRVTDLEPLADQAGEDPKVTIARLQGQLDEARTNEPKKKTAK